MSRGKVIICKVGLDGHTTGAAVVASGLRDAGFTVINLGTRVTPEQVAVAAVQEDVDAVGLSILSGAHLSLTQRVLDEGRKLGMASAVLVGGTIADDDAAKLKEMGVSAVFGPGSPIADIVSAVDACVAKRRAEREAEAEPQS